MSTERVRCPRCWGRGYIPEKRKPSKRNPNGLGFYARTCPRCRGTAQIDQKVKRPADHSTGR